MIIRNFFKSLLNICLIISIVLVVYFLGISFIFKCSFNIMSFIFSIHDLFQYSIKFFLVFYSSFEVYFIDEIFSLKTNLNAGFKHLYNDINFAKILINWYFYPKFFFGGFYINIDEHNLMNFKPVWAFSYLDMTTAQNSNFVTVLLKKQPYFIVDYPKSNLLDYYWGSFRWKVTQGDLTLMPGDYYRAMLHRFMRRFFKYTVWMSGVNLYIPSWAFYENFFSDYLYNSFRVLVVYLSYIIFSLLKYKSIVSLLWFFLAARLIININVLVKYISGNIMMQHSYLSPSIFTKAFIFIILLGLILFTWKNYFLFLLFSFFLFYSFVIRVLSLYGGFLHYNKLSYYFSKFVYFLVISVRVKVLSLLKKKKNRKLRYRYKYFMYVILSVSAILNRSFRYYFSYLFPYYVKLQKPLKKVIRWQLYYTAWDTHISSSLVNPLKYSDMSVPVVLKGSRGGLWVRTTKKTYAKHLMYENKNGLWFFRHKDRYDVWECSHEFGIHIYDQKELLVLNSDNFFNNFFIGAKNVFTSSTNKAKIIGGVNHYDIYHKFMASSDIHTYMRLFRVALIQRIISLILYRIFMYISPIIVRIVYLFYSYVVNRSILILFFVSGWLRAQVEFTSFNIDSEYMPYLRFLEFYKLPGYLFFDYYLTKKAPYLTLDNRRHNQVYFLKQLDGWIMRYKFFELKPEAYFVINGGLQRGVMSFAPLLVMKLSKWTLLFYKHIPFEYLIFALVSLLSHLWIFNRIFVIFDTYIYRCMYPSIWAKKKLIFNTSRIRFHHGMLRSRWLRNRRSMTNLKRGKYVHTRYNNLSEGDLF